MKIHVLFQGLSPNVFG